MMDIAIPLKFLASILVISMFILGCTNQVKTKNNVSNALKMQLDAVESDGAVRFIVVIKEEKDTKSQNQNQELITDAFLKADAVSVESLDGVRIFLVLSEKSTILSVAERTGLIESVTVDTPLAPNAPVGRKN